MTSNTYNFLDVSITRLPNGELQSGVHVETTDSGVYAKLNSHTALQYKRLVVKTLVNRAINRSTTMGAMPR